MAFSLSDLETLIGERASSTAQASYTKSLLDKGVLHCAKKFGEEAIETILAAGQQPKAALVGETADVLYHLLVLLRACDVPLSEVMKTLEQRTAQSGHSEKASRG